MSGIFRMPKKPTGQFGLSCRLISEKPFEIAYGKCVEMHVFENKIINRNSSLPTKSRPDASVNTSI